MYSGMEYWTGLMCMFDHMSLLKDARLTIFMISFIKHFIFPIEGGACLAIHFQCRIPLLELEAFVKGWRYAKHVSYIRVTICLCTAINLRLDVDCSRFALSYPTYYPATLTSCCNNGCWPPHRWLSARRGQQKGPVDPYTHTHTTSPSHTSSVFHTMTNVNTHRAEGARERPVQWQIAAQDNRPRCSTPEGLLRSLTGWPSSITSPLLPLSSTIPFSIAARPPAFIQTIALVL